MADYEQMSMGVVAFDEMNGTNGSSEGRRDCYSQYGDWYDAEDVRRLRSKVREAQAGFRTTGITFNTYDDNNRSASTERLIPFDIVPRILTGREWADLADGLEQRVRAINDFLFDVYHEAEIVKAGVLPESLVFGNSAYLPQMKGFSPPGNVYTHIVGVDLVRTDEDEFYVLEDNARTPSGVSYMLENRETMQRMFPELFADLNIEPIRNYPTRLRAALESCAPVATRQNAERARSEESSIAVLTPGVHNAAYYEHSFLASKLGAALVEAHDLRIVGGRLAMRTTNGYAPIDVLYRRVDDDFLDPLTFRSDSLLGVAGMFDIYRAGRLAIVNAPGAGLADDKAMYSYMPEIIKFYSGREPLIRNVETWRCSEPDSLAYVLDHLDELVVKQTQGSGGYGMLVGPTASRRELAAFRRKLIANNSDYVAQPTLALSTVPIFKRSELVPRHVDLRPFVLSSPNGVDIVPGGLTRVALKKGSLVVNSSQGGGTKDTWVLADE